MANPLLFAVRSGARDSMPGMMDTILNLGLNDETVQGLIAASGNERFAYDCYRRFIQMYGDVVMGVQKRAGEHHEPFEVVIETLKNEIFPGRRGVSDTELDAAALKRADRALQETGTRAHRPAISRPIRTSNCAARSGAVFGSWMNERAIVYRQKYNIPTEWGTAVNVQSMVFGNTGDESCSGVAFTRDPATGEKVFYGEYLINAQGEDVVAGVRTPDPVATLQEKMPKAYRELEDVRASLEKHFHEMQDFEFTVENGKLFMLQTRNGKRTGVAAVRIAVRDGEGKADHLAGCGLARSGRPAQPASHADLRPQGDQARGEDRLRIARRSRRGHRPDLFQCQRSGGRIGQGQGAPRPRGDFAGRHPRHARGGRHPHRARRRQLARRARRAADGQGLRLRRAARCTSIITRAPSPSADSVFRKGDFLSIDGTSGEVSPARSRRPRRKSSRCWSTRRSIRRKAPTYGNFAQLMGWADKLRKLQIRTNADQPDQVANAVAFGAQGVGLCRTEHMFFEGDRIDAVREMILAETKEARETAVAKLLPYQRSDFAGHFPLAQRTARHDPLPRPAPARVPAADRRNSRTNWPHKLGVSAETVARRVADLHEFNPMLGHRGCRLGIVYPEISAMQARAIFEAAIEVQKEGIKVKPEIMIPLVGFPKELELQAELVREVAAQVGKEHNARLNYLVGTMIEIPRACVVADEIAKEAEFFSFGTNDLTQTTLGMSRDDSGSFLPAYQSLEIIKQNPFATVDMAGVGGLMKMAIERGRKTRPDIKLGICGEHGGDPASVKFCHDIGPDLCQLLAFPRAHRAAGGGAGGLGPSCFKVFTKNEPREATNHPVAARNKGCNAQTGPSSCGWNRINFTYVRGRRRFWH